MITALKLDLICMRNLLKPTALTLAIMSVAFLVSIGPTGAMAGVSASGCYIMVNNLLAYDETNGLQAYRLSLPITRSQVIWGRALACVVAAVASVLAAFLVAGAWYLVGLIPGIADSGLPGFADTHVFVEEPIMLLVIGACAASASLALAAVILPFWAKVGYSKSVRFIPFAAFGLLMVGTVLALSVMGGTGTSVETATMMAMQAGTGSDLAATATMNVADVPATEWSSTSGAIVFAAVPGLCLAFWTMMTAIAARIYRTREL